MPIGRGPSTFASPGRKVLGGKPDQEPERGFEIWRFEFKITTGRKNREGTRIEGRWMMDDGRSGDEEEVVDMDGGGIEHDDEDNKSQKRAKSR